MLGWVCQFTDLTFWTQNIYHTARCAQFQQILNARRTNRDFCGVVRFNVSRDAPVHEDSISWPQAVVSLPRQLCCLDHMLQRKHFSNTFATTNNFNRITVPIQQHANSVIIVVIPMNSLSHFVPQTHEFSFPWTWFVAFAALSTEAYFRLIGRETIFDYWQSVLYRTQSHRISAKKKPFFN